MRQEGPRAYGRPTMTFRYSTEDVYHLGIVVPDIDRGMEEIGRRFNVTFPPHLPIEVDLTVGRREFHLSTRFVYSREGPPYIELFQGVPDSPFALPRDGSGIHHLGIFVDDMAAEVARLKALGTELELHDIGIDGQPRGVAFFNSLGVRQELVSSESRTGLKWLTTRS